MSKTLQTIGWIACIIYSTIPAFWLLIHPRADYWRARRKSPYRILLPLWIGMWVAAALITAPWRTFLLYKNNLTWIPAGILFGGGLLLYKLSRHQFTLAQLGGLSEISPGRREQRLATAGIRARVRHPVYLGDLCEMLAWSAGTGLAVCWALTAFAIASGAMMIRMEDKELEIRFGEEYRRYRSTVPAVLPRRR
ncbi:MAG: isoprenylcysteine carboxylmethyltransferase family protein [Candidatus Sulfotelmatobacter sp.]